MNKKKNLESERPKEDLNLLFHQVFKMAYKNPTAVLAYQNIHANFGSKNTCYKRNTGKVKEDRRECPGKSLKINSV